jgi:tetratricopeptide (TPR) repeat protein
LKQPSRKRDSGRKPIKGAEPALHLTPGKKWLFRIAALMLPLFALLCFEMALRLAGYGYKTSFFKTIQIDGEPFYVENDQVGLRFFPPQMVRMPAPNRMRVKKAADTYRIFVFGESAAMGDPEPAFGAGRYLQAMLEHRFAGQKFEVINVAMTAINSHAVLPFAKECAGLGGDLWIIYMGNNEMVGPFGVATVFGAKTPPMAFVRLNLAIQKTRTGQLMMAGLRRLSGKKEKSAAWGGMEMFLQNQIGPEDARKETVYHHFNANLREMLRAGLGSGARIVLNTVAVNLKDCPPFASLNDSNLTSTARAEFNAIYAKAATAESQGRPAEAAQFYEQASKANGRFAELQYRWGSCLLQLTNVAEARKHLQLACDSDALPFRTDTRINESITTAANEAADSHLRLLDAVASLQQQSPVGICGQESFSEHVHFTFEGNYWLGRAWADEVEQLMPEQIRMAAKAAGTTNLTTWASQETCERRLGLTDWNRVGVLEAIVRRLLRPPLSSQFNNPGRLQALQNQLRSVRERMDETAATKARELYLEALRRAPEDFYVHEHFADFLEATGDFQQATLEWREARKLIPQDFLASFQLGRLLVRAGAIDEAKASILQAVALRPTYSDGWFELGKIYDLEGKSDLALQEYQHAIQLQPSNYQVYCSLGKLLSRLNRTAEAFENLREAVRLNPEYWEGHYALGGALGYDNQVATAKHEFEEVTRLNPRFAMGHLNLGVALLKEGQFTNAAREFETTLRLEPTNSVAQSYLEQSRSGSGAK